MGDKKKKYHYENTDIIGESRNFKLIRCADKKYRFINNKNQEKRNFTFSINEEDRNDKEFMEFIINQTDLSKSIHKLILSWIEEYGTNNIRLDRKGNYIEENNTNA